MKHSKHAYIVTFVLVLMILAVFTGCKSKPQANNLSTEKPESTLEPSVKPTNEPTSKPSNIPTQEPIAQPPEKQTPVPSVSPDRQATLLDEKIAQQPVLDTGLTLDDIAKYLNLEDRIIYEEFEDVFEFVRGHMNASEYTEYLFSDLGLRLVTYDDWTFKSRSSVKYIELERDSVSFAGVQSDMNFEEVISILGEA